MLTLSVHSITNLHKVLFDNIYSFTGEIRDVSLVKNQTRFCEHQFIEENLIKIIEEIANELPFKNKKLASKRLAYFKTELNIIHPFREGNGRTIRLFIREVAKSLGYNWEFEFIGRTEYIEAMIESKLDTTQLEVLFSKSLSKIKF